ncbi:MAG: carboxylesterase/lipase family protein [Bacteroidales bacterium]|nr:carboxylesterase/lipase family protein [Bacteroidales bacterium]
MKLLRFFLPALLVASCCSGEKKAAQNDGQRLFVGDDYAVTQTQYGKVQGYILDDVYTYLGIPYGAPTGGANRFLPPQKPESWEGIRPAMFYGNDAPQNMDNKWRNNSSTFTDHWNYYDVSEDCLNLNVWTPAPDGKKRPVLVWMHGGGFSSGNSVEQDGYTGANLARGGDIVFVSVNHRLNAFGFTDLSSSGNPAFKESGNVGILDLVASLQWVHDNIANFGGDPGNVTIIGQSGGGAKVCDVISMPAAKGLVHKAVALSGNATSAMDPATSAAIGAAILKNVRGDVKKLQAMPWEEYYAFAHRVASGLGGFSPVADGSVLPADGFFKDDMAADIPLILCTTSSEFSLSKENLEMENLTFDGAVAVVRDQFGQANAEEILKAYQAAFPDKKPIELVNLTVAQRKNVLATADAKSQQKAPVYLAWFDYNAPLFGGRIRAFHCSDICYWFKNTDLMVTHTGGGAEPRGVSDQMSAALLAFMRTGNPNCPEIPEWPAYTPEDAPTMIFNVKSEVRNAPDRAALELMSDFNPWRMARPAPAKK